MKPITKALKVAKKLNIRVIIVKSFVNSNTGKNEPGTLGYWEKGRTIHIPNSCKDPYVVLHEVGHVLNGYMCCTEHCEYAAHGAAIALAKTHGIRLPRGAKHFIDTYAGCSSRKSCGAINP